MLTKDDVKIIKELLVEQETRFKNDVVEFKDEILAEIIKLRDDLTMVEGWRTMMADQEEEIEKIKAAIHL